MATGCPHPAKKKPLNPPFLAPSFSVYPRQHTYSLGLITLSLLLQLSACVGLRGVEAPAIAPSPLGAIAGAADGYG